jgi:hypothetical protein
MSSLLDELKRRAKQAGEFAPFWDFKENPEFVGRVVAVRDDPRSPEDSPRHLWDVETLDGQRYTLPSYVVLDRALAEQGAEVGKYIYAHFIGEGKKAGRGGRKPFLFEVAVMSQEEAEAHLKAPPKVERRKKPEAEPKVGEKPKEEPKPKVEEKPKAEEYSQVEFEKGKSIINTLFQTGYAELEAEKLRKYLEGQGVRIPLEDLCEKMGLKIEEGKVRK